MTFSIGDLKFIDIFQLMASTLDNLISSFYDKEEKFNNFTNMKSQFPDHMDLLCMKGIYPYGWMDGIIHCDAHPGVSSSATPTLRPSMLSPLRS